MDALLTKGLSRFKLLGRLGKGGMGVVYRAFDVERGREVALKTLPSMDADGIYRLKREFRSLAELSHPNLVNLYELFSENGQWYFTMERVEGVGFLSWVAEKRNALEAPLLPVPPPTPQVAETDGSGPTFVQPDSGGQVSTTAAPRLVPVPSDRGEGLVPEERLDEAETRPRAAKLLPREGTPAVAAVPMQKRPATFDEGRLRLALRQLARGVYTLHQAGKQHHDLKPQNVMVTPDGRVVILDFGLTRAHRPDELYSEQMTDRFSGTPDYMSPERVTGIVAHESSDWYSVGVMLYEALTGVKPYSHPSIYLGPAVAAPPPSALVEGVPEDLDRLTMELLHWNPAARPGGLEILRRLGERPSETALAPTESGAHRVLFVGRAEQLHALESAFDTLVSGRPVLMQVKGSSGFGKTALVRQFIQRLHDADKAVVLEGRCYERESVPYKVFDSLIDALTRYLQTLSGFEVAKLLPPDVRVLAKLFPPLLRVQAVTETPLRDLEGQDVQETARRASGALRDFLARLAARKPLVLFIDDLQWGDLDSARLLADLLRPPDLPRVLLIVSFRSEDVQGNPVLRELLQATKAGRKALANHTLEVGPLSPEEAKILAREVLGQAGAKNMNPDTLIPEASGSPLFVQQLAQYAAAGTQLDATTGISLSTVLRARVAQLPGHAGELLQAVCVAGRPVPQQLALRTASLVSEADEALQLLRVHNLVRMGGPRRTDTIEVYHDKIRETVVGTLAPDALRALHERIAMLLEVELPQDAEALTEHWQAAGNLSRASSFAIQAARRANASLAFERAAQLYAQALRGYDDSHPDVPALKRARANALRDAGRGPEAAQAYLEAANAAVAPSEKLEARRLAFEQFLVSGYLERGREVAAEVLRSVGMQLPRGGRAALVSLLLQRMKVSLRGFRFDERSEADIPRDLLQRIDACWSMATGLSMIDTKLGADFNARYVLYALEGGEAGRISRALAFEASHVATSGKFPQAERLLRSARALAEKGDDPHPKGFVAQNEGFLEYFSGHYRRSLEAFDRASAIFRQQCRGATWETATSEMFSNWSLVYLGEWRELASRGPRLLAEAERSGNLYREEGLRMSYRVASGLMVDDVDRLRREMDEGAKRWTPSGFQIQHFLRLYMSSWIDLYAGDGKSAWQRLERQRSALRRSLLLRVEDVRYRVALVEGYSALASGATPELHGAARRAVRVLEKIQSVGSGGVSRLIQAVLAQRDGRDEEAAAKVEAAIAEFKRAEMALFESAARWRLGQLHGGKAGRAEITSAQQAMSARGIKRPEALLRVFAPGFKD